jgi:histidine triad (HIT) family protein
VGEVKKNFGDFGMDCIFCKVVAGEIPTEFLYEDESVVAFNDIKPHAPHHMLIVPRKHIATINDLTEEDNVLVGQMFQTAKHLAKKLGVAEEGYRLVMNCNEGAGQTVFHIHLHFLSGRPLHWPPG